MKIFILVFVLLLSACKTAPTVPDVIITPKVVHVDARALIPCKKLEELDSTNPTFEDVLISISKNFTLYVECAGKQDASIKLLREFGNIKD